MSKAKATETFVEMSVPIRVGEVCYNFRSALDYLIFELAKLDSGVEQGGTQFPIMDSPKDSRPPPCTLATVRPPTARGITRSSRWVFASCPATPTVRCEARP